jgi:hypothetical protein
VRLRLPRIPGSDSVVRASPRQQARQRQGRCQQPPRAPAAVKQAESEPPRISGSAPAWQALSIRQPFVEQILRGIKTAELRSRSTTIVGERFYIYAAEAKAKRLVECASTNTGD